MSEYDDMLDEAEENAEEKIAEKLAGTKTDLSKLEDAFKDGPNKEHMNQLVAKLKSSADSAAKKKAWKEFGVSAGLNALKAARKAIFPALLVMLAVSAPAIAQIPDGTITTAKMGGMVVTTEKISNGAFVTSPKIKNDAVTTDPDQFDITTLLDKMGACSAITHHGDILFGACYEAISFPGEWGGIFGGVTWATNSLNQQRKEGLDKVGGAMLAVGFRADTVGKWAWTRTGLGSRGFKINFRLPKIKFGPTGGYAKNAAGWYYGGFLNANYPFGGAK